MDNAETFGEHSVGLVETSFFTFDRLPLRSGKILGPVTLAYETYGSLNEDKSNAILIVAREAVVGKRPCGRVSYARGQEPGLVGPLYRPRQTV